MYVKDTMNDYNLELIEKQIRTQNLSIGSKIHYLKDTASTMSVAKEFATKGCQDGTTVISSTQLNGRGRLGKDWSSPEGGLWMSIVLRHQLSMDQAQLLTLGAGTAVCKTIENVYRLNPGLKWPNDVIVSGKKVCGILAEGAVSSGKPDYAVLGMGVNLNFPAGLLPKELQQYATTLLDLTGFHVEFEEFLYKLLYELNLMYKELTSNKPYILELWKHYSVTLGSYVTAYFGGHTVEGVARDIAQDGSLVIETGAGNLIEVCSGEVSIRGLGSYT